MHLTSQLPAESPARDETLLRGCFRILFLYDVAEAFDMNKLRGCLGPNAEPVKQVFPRRTPEYIRFEQVPIIEPAQPITLATGDHVLCSVKYYAFAVAVVQFDVPFECDWNSLLTQSSRWTDPVDIEPHARELLRQHLDRVAPAVVRPTTEWLHEDYLVINLENIASDGSPMPASRLLSSHAHQIAQLLRGELTSLSPRLSEDLLEASLSYYETDLVVIGSSAALVYDRSEDAAATSLVLEYAKMQLLEFRYYDGLMTQLLSDVYDALERKRNILISRWSIPRDAKRFNTIRLDVMELTERIDNAIKFVSDVYYARLYRLASTRMGVPEYRNLLDEKLRTVGELYDFMVDQFNEARSFVVEVAIAVLCLLDAIFWLKK